MIIQVTPTGTDPLRGPRRGVMVLLAAMAATFGGFLIWSNLVQIDIAATGTGRIVPSRQVQVIQNLEGGIVNEMLIKEGDKVTRDQVLARIQNVEFTASYNEANANSAGLQLELARLKAETEGGGLSFPGALERSHPELVSKEANLYQSRQAELGATIGGLREEVKRARNSMRKAQENLPILKRSLALAHEQRGIVEPQVKKGLISRVELLTVEQRILELTTKINEASREIPAAAAAAAEAEQKIEAERQRFRSQALGRLTEVRTKLNGLNAMITAHKDRVERREVTSPVNGVVKKVFVNTKGGVVRPGDSLVEIVPTDDILIVEARFSPKDIAFIHPDQTAYIRVTAYDASIYGALPAKVVQVSADATVTERDEVYYTVRAQATRGFEGKNSDLPLIPGMVSQVDVVTGKRTVFDYLTKPITTLKYTAMHER